MLKKLNKKNRILYWVTTLFFVLIIINSFLEKEIQTEQDLTQKNIKINKIQTIKHQKGLGESIAIIDSKNDEYRITLKTKDCLIKDLKKDLKSNDLIIIGFKENYSFLDYFKPYYETYIVRKNNGDFIDFKCVSNESHFGKRKLIIILIVLNIIILYLLTITQKTTNKE